MTMEGNAPMKKARGVLAVAGLALGLSLGTCSAAFADDGNDLYWSQAGTDGQYSSVVDPAAGRCYTFGGGHLEYAYNETNMTAEYFGGPGCSRPEGSLPPGGFGDIPGHVVF